MKKFIKKSYFLFAFILIFFVGLGILAFSFASNGSKWAMNSINSHIYQNGKLTTAGTIYDRNKTVLVETKNGTRQYNENYTLRLATLHLLGDKRGMIGSGIQTKYKTDLLGYNPVSGLYKGIFQKKKNDLTLTIDANVQKAAYRAMNGRKGAVMVYNYKSGETICMTSAPSFDPESAITKKVLEASLDHPYLNCCTQGRFTPGSTFKIVTTICAIENMPDVKNRTFTCKGKYSTGDKKSDGVVKCNNLNGHGKLSLEKALNVSCNCVFAQLAKELGEEKMAQTAKELGFNAPISIGKLTTTPSVYDVSKANRLELAWTGIGQEPGKSKLEVNPAHMLKLVGAIANNGTSVNPNIIKGDKSIIDETFVLDPAIAKTVKALLRSNVENYYGDYRFPNLKMCGKTGTAQVDKKQCHTWFVGFSQRTDFPYAIVVVLENSGGSGIYTAIPVANKTMQATLTALKSK